MASCANTNDLHFFLKKKKEKKESFYKSLFINKDAITSNNLPSLCILWIMHCETQTKLGVNTNKSLKTS